MSVAFLPPVRPPKVPNVPLRAILTQLKTTELGGSYSWIPILSLREALFHIHIFLSINSFKELLFSSDSCCISFVDLVCSSFHFIHIWMLWNLFKSPFFLISLFYPLPDILICSGCFSSCLVSFFESLQLFYLFYILFLLSFFPLAVNLKF